MTSGGSDDAQRAGAVSAAPAFWMLVGVAALWVVMSLTYPFGWDQGIYAWAGDVVVRGGMPYRDAWDIKGPAAYYGFALARWLFGPGLWGVRLVDAAVVAGAAVVLARTVAARTDRDTGRWSAVVFVLWYASHSFWHTAQPDGWVAMVVAFAVLPAVAKAAPLSVASIAASGALIGIATLIKPIYAVFLVLPVLHASMAGSLRVSTLAALVAGWGVTIAACVAWFAARGALDEFLDVYLRYTSTAYAGLDGVGVGIGARARGLVLYALGAPAIAVGLPAVIVGGIALWRTQRAAAAVLITWCAIVVALVTLQGRFFAYHWLPLLPPAVMLGAVGVRHTIARVRAMGVAIAAVVLATVLAPIAWEELRFVSWVAGRTDTAAYYDAYGEPGSDMRAVTWLNEHGRDGKIFVFGWNAAVAALSGRETVSRFGFSMPLLMGDEHGIRARYRDEVMRALTADPPVYILVGTQSAEILRREASVNDFPAFASMLRDAYRPVAEFGAIAIHERTAGLAALR